MKLKSLSFSLSLFSENKYNRMGAHLIVAIAGDLDARLPHLHVHNQTFDHRQRVLVVTEVLGQWKRKKKNKT